MKRKKKLILWCALALILVSMPVSRAFAEQSSMTALQPSYGIQALESKYLSSISAALDHKESNGYFYLTGSTIHNHDKYYRIKITLRLLRSESMNLNGNWVEKGSYWEKFTTPGMDTLTYTYKDAYETYYFYAAETKVEVYYLQTVNVIETVTAMSNPIRVTR